MLGISRSLIGRILELCLNLNLKKQLKGWHSSFFRTKFPKISRISQNKYFMFREMWCFTKLALACESQFCISRSKTFNKQNETKLQNQTKKRFLLNYNCRLLKAEVSSWVLVISPDYSGAAGYRQKGQIYWETEVQSTVLGTFQIISFITSARHLLNY